MNEQNRTVSPARAEMVTEMFAAIDRMDVEGLLGYMAEDAWQRFGNADSLHGHQQIRRANEEFLGSLASIHHEIIGIWESAAGVVCRLRVTYGRKDGKVVTIPGVTIFEEHDGQISGYQVYFDVEPVFAEEPHEVQMDSAQVLSA